MKRSFLVPPGLSFLIIAAHLFLAACGSSDSSDSPRQGHCISDASCAPGQRCVDGACVEAPEPDQPTIVAPDVVTSGSERIGARIEAPQANVTYSWSIRGGRFTSGTEGSDVVFDVGEGPELTLTVEASNALGDTKTASRTLAVVAPPDATATHPAIVTSGKEGLVASVPAQPGSTYAWTLEGGTITEGADAATVVFTAGEPGTLLLGVTVTNAAGDSVSSSASIEVVAAPNAEIATRTAPVTAGASGLRASVAAQERSSYEWTVTGGTIVAGQGTDTITFDAGDAGTMRISVVVTNAAGDSADHEVEIPVVPPPVADLRVAAIVTAGVPRTAEVSEQPGATYQWRVQDGEIVAGAGTSSISFVVGWFGTTEVSVTVTNAAGDSVSSSAVVEVIRPPDAGISSSDDALTAGREDYAAWVFPEPGSTYSWSISGGFITEGHDTEMIRFTAGEPGTLRLVVTATNAAGDSATGERTFTVFPVPIADPRGPAYVISHSGGHVASVTEQEGAEYTWSIINGTITSGQGTPSITFTAGDPGSVVLSVLVRNPAGYGVMGHANVQALPPAVATISTESGPLTAGKYGYVASVPAQLDSTFTWTVTNGTISGGQGTHEIRFAPEEAGTLTLSVVVSNAAGDTATDSVTLTVIPAPNAWIEAPNVVTVGKSGYVARVAEQPGARYQWTASNATITGGEETHAITFAAESPGMVSISVTVTNAAGDSDTTTAYMRADPAPDATITTAYPAVTVGRSGYTASVPLDPYATYEWVVEGGIITRGENSHQVSFTSQVAGTLTLSVVVTNAAGDSASNQLSLPVVPPADATISAPTRVEGGSSHVASVPDQPGATYVWSISNGAITGGQGTPSITFTAGNSGPVYLTAAVTNATGDSSREETVSVEVVPLPDANIQTPAILSARKSGYNARVPSQPGATYEWLISNGTITAGFQTNEIVYTAGNAGTLTLSLVVTNAFGTSATREVTIPVVDPPNATMSLPASATTGKGGYVAQVPQQNDCTFQWTVNGGTLTSGQGTNQITFAAGPVGQMSVTVVVTNAAGVSASANRFLTVYADPVAEITVPEVVTVGTWVRAYAPPQSGLTFQWTISNGWFTDGQGSPNIGFVIDVPGTSELRLTVSNPDGEIATATKTVTAVPVPIATITTVSGPITAGATGLTASVPAQPNSTYEWFISSGRITGGEGTPTVTFEAPWAGSLYVSVRVTNAAGDSTSRAVFIRVVPVPDATIAAPAAVTAGKEGLIASVPAQADSTFSWTVENGTITDGDGTRQITFTAGTSGEVILSVSVTNAASTRVDGTRTITIVPPPVAELTAPDGPLTAGRSGFVASVGSQPGVTYSWTIENGTIVSGQGTPEVIFSTGSSGQLRLACTVTNQAGDDATASKVIPIISLPDVNIAAPSVVVTGKEGLTASVPEQPGTTYQWSIDGGTITSGADTHQITFTAGSVGSLTLEVLATNAAGDSAAGERHVDVAWGLFTSTGSMAEARKFPEAVALQDGRVLVVGGMGDYSLPLSSAELFSPESESFAPTAAMGTRRTSHTLTLLADGRVLAVGGWNGSAVQGSAEIYDPVTGTWTQTGSMSTPRENHTATLLDDGRVLVVGGLSASFLASAEIWDPETGLWTPTGSLAIARHEHSAVLLEDGRVLVFGGETSQAYLNAAEIYDPTTGLWSSAGTTTTIRNRAPAVRLLDGRVLITGGYNGWTSISAASELYDPTSGLFVATPPMPAARAAHAAVLLSNGWVLVAGGYELVGSPTIGWSPSSLSAAEMYDPATDTWIPVEPMSMSRSMAGSAVLPDGRVLIMGGQTEINRGNYTTYVTTNTAEIFDY